MISYVVVTHNSQEHFPQVVLNLRACTPLEHEIVVVDNSSRGDDYLQADRVIRNGHNRRFTRAANQGLAAAHPRATHLLLVNPDIRFHPDTVHDLLADVEASGAGLASPILVYPDLRVQHAGGEAYPGLADEAVLALDHHAHRMYGRTLAEVRGEFPARVRWVTGACLLVTRETYARLGPLDERFDHYRSDLEYCLRAAHAGIGVICSRAVGLHFHKRSSRGRLANLAPFLGSLRKRRYAVLTRGFVERIALLDGDAPG